MNRVLRISRIIVAVAVLALLTVGITLPVLAWAPATELLGRVQVETAVCTYTLAIIIVWLVITLAFGRIYCSTLCPLGSVMDCAGVAARRLNRRLPPLRYVAPSRWSRYIFLAVLAVALMAGMGAVVSVLMPYSVFTRICHGTFEPLVTLVAQLLASAGVESAQSAVAITGSIAGSIIATALFFIIIWVASARGRRLCNTICPIGTALGLVSRYSVFQFDIDTDLCTQCRKCVDVCKGECIDIESHVVDSSRCVVCFNCVDICRDRAIRYTTSRKQLSVPMMQRISGIATEPETARTSTFNTPSRHNNETVSTTPVAHND